jgi:hypothetical protein
MIKKHIFPEGVVMYSVLMFYLKAFYAVPAGDINNNEPLALLWGFWPSGALER